MASLVKYTSFITELGLGSHSLNTDTLKVALTNATPNIAHTVFDPTAGTGNHAVPAAANGYAAIDITNAWSSGTLTSADTVTFTAAGGDIGPFRYVILYNDTNATDMLIGYYDYGSSIILTDTQPFTVDFAASILTIT